jgi:hypothetical protein
VKERRIIDESR